MPSGLWLYSYIALWGLLLIVSALLVGVLRQITALHAYCVRNDPEWGLPLASMAPALPERDLFGRRLSLGASRGKKTLLYFVSRHCSSCRAAMRLVPLLSEAVDEFELVLIVGSSETDSRMFLEEHRRKDAFPGVHVVADPSGRLMAEYKVAAVPYVVVVDEAGRIGARGGGVTSGELGGLIAQADRLRRIRSGETGAEDQAPGPEAVMTDGRLAMSP